MKSDSNHAEKQVTKKRMETQNPEYQIYLGGEAKQIVKILTNCSELLSQKNEN